MGENGGGSRAAPMCANEEKRAICMSFHLREKVTGRVGLSAKNGEKNTNFDIKLAQLSLQPSQILIFSRSKGNDDRGIIFLP